jgi:hypothetical protein
VSGHTPGPWQFQANSTDTALLIEGDVLVASMSWHSSSRQRHPLRSESQANARLIAAAPELLAALQALHRMCRDCDLETQAQRPTEQQYNDAMDAAEAAIAKAAGAAS